MIATVAKFFQGAGVALISMLAGAFIYWLGTKKPGGEA